MWRSLHFSVSGWFSRAKAITVIMHGGVTLYEPRGSSTLQIDLIQPTRYVLQLRTPAKNSTGLFDISRNALFRLPSRRRRRPPRPGGLAWHQRSHCSSYPVPGDFVASSVRETCGTHRQRSSSSGISLA